MAVVVPSPATSLVAVATSRTSWAPWLENGSSSLDLTSDRYAVVGDGGGTELLVDHDIAALGAERDLDRVRDGVDAVLERATCLHVVLQFLVSHVCVSS